LLIFGEALLAAQSVNFITKYPANMPTMGEISSERIITINPCILTTSKPAASTADPNKPPSIACDDEEGIPKCQVKRFQRMAAINAEMIAISFNTLASRRSAPTVLATATPKMNGPQKLAMAAIVNAVRGRIAWDEITVATMFELSCTPLMKSRARAEITSTKKVFMES
jgi:hypothetical protein